MHPIDNLSELAKEQALPAILTLVCYGLGGGKFVDANAVLKVPEERSARDAQRDIALGYAIAWVREELPAAESSGEGAGDPEGKGKETTDPAGPEPAAGAQHRDPAAENRDPAVSGPKDLPPAAGRRNRG